MDIKTGLPVTHCEVFEPHEFLQANQQRSDYMKGKVTLLRLPSNDPEDVKIQYSS